MNNNQQNPNWNPNNQEGQKANMPSEGNSNPQMNMQNMPGGNMQMNPNMMAYAMPNYMNHMPMGGMSHNPNMGGVMYPNGSGMMPQDGNQMQSNNPNDQNNPKAEDSQNNNQTPAGNDENNQNPTPEPQVEKRDQNPEGEVAPGGEGKALDENAVTQGAIQENSQPADQRPNIQSQQNMGEISKENREEGDEGEDGKYNLRKRSRKELPAYYCELSDDENKANGNRKRPKKGEEDYDPNQDEENDNRQGKQQNNQDMGNNPGGNFGMQNQMNPAMMHQMMMQQMSGNPGMGMPNVNDVSANLNNMNNMMASQYPQNPMGQQNFPNSGQNNTQVQEKSGGCNGAKEGPGGICTHCNKPKPPPELLAQILSLQNNRTAQMMQGINDPSSYMAGGGSVVPGMGGNGFNGGSANPTPGGAAQNMSGGNNYDTSNANQYTMQSTGNAGQANSAQQDPSKMQNNSMNQPGYNMMEGRNGGNSMPAGGSGQNFDPNNFPGSNQMGMNPMMGGFQNMNQFPPGAGGNGMNNMGFPSNYSMNSTGTNQNSQGNNQNLTPEQMQQMMQRQMMQGGGQWMNNMNPGGN